MPNSAVVHTDDIAWNHAYFDWGSLLVENILQPLRRGEAVDFRPEAWITHNRPGSIAVPAGADFIWVEGTGIIREELAPWLDASVWIQGDLDEQERVSAVRDGDSPEQLEHVANWLLEELPFMLREQPWARATMIVSRPSADRPRPGHRVGHRPADQPLVSPVPVVAGAAGDVSGQVDPRRGGAEGVVAAVTTTPPGSRLRDTVRSFLTAHGSRHLSQNPLRSQDRAPQMQITIFPRVRPPSACAWASAIRSKG